MISNLLSPYIFNTSECILYILERAVENNLFETKEFVPGKVWKTGTFLKFLEGDGMDFKTMKSIIRKIVDMGYAIYTWGLFGVGGGLRNGLKRDNINDDDGVVKLSGEIGKTTLPGPFKVLRSAEALANKKTIVFATEPGENAMVLYFDGNNIYKPFGPGQDDDFATIKNRIREQAKTMPKNLNTTHGAPASDLIIAKRIELIKKYAPNRDTTKY